MINRLLFFVRNSKCVRTTINNYNNVYNYKLVLREVVVKTTISIYHDSPLGGHSGIQNTIDMMQEQYYVRSSIKKFRIMSVHVQIVKVINIRPGRGGRAPP